MHNRFDPSRIAIGSRPEFVKRFIVRVEKSGKKKRVSQDYGGAWKIENAYLEMQSEIKDSSWKFRKVNKFWFISDLFEVLEKKKIGQLM